MGIIGSGAYGGLNLLFDEYKLHQTRRHFYSVAVREVGAHVKWWWVDVLFIALIVGITIHVWSHHL